MEGINNRWTAAAASIWIQLMSGSYTFGIYSSILKSSQGYDQSTLDTVSVFKDIGANVGIISGLLYASVASRGRGGVVGPWSVHLAGAIQCFIGYFLIWLSITGVIDRPPVLAMCFFMLIASHAQTFFNTANVVTAVGNFPEYSGTIVGIMKGFMGLSGAVLIQAYQTFMPGNPSGFILMLAFLPTIVSVSLMFLVKVHPTSSGSVDKKYLNWFSYIALALAIYLLVLIIFENISTLSKRAHFLAFALLLLLMLSSLFGVANRAQRGESARFPEPISDVRSQLMDGNSVEKEKLVSKDMNLVQAMHTFSFWSLFFAMLCGMGSGIATINNISQIGESLEYKTEEINTLVSLWSIWNFLGRLGAGYISDIFLHSRGWARPMFMAGTLATMSVGHLIIASGFPGNLYVGSILVGICYGSQWSLMPTITSELFGIVNMGTIFNTIAIASPVGSSILSVLVVGKIYDMEASGDGKSCFGTRCFMLSFSVLASVSFLGFLVALALFFRTRRFYTELWLRHYSN